jgi:peptide/nickel transport system permease protein
MRRFLLRRLLLAVFTIFVLSILVFFATHALPGDVAKKVLGAFADEQSIKDLNHELGTDRPITVQYFTWISHAAHGDLGKSYLYDKPVTEKLRTAIGYSAKLAVLAFMMIIPVSIIGGIFTGLRKDTRIDRFMTVGGLSAAAIPEFVWAVFFVLVFGIKLRWLPASATPPLDSDPNVLTQYKHLVLPAMCLMMVLYGYIARITRAGIVEANDSDYTRTAHLKGLPRRSVVRKHVLRNALMPTIAVVATQTTYLIGGLVTVETYFNYNGLGLLLKNAVQQRDYLLVQAAVLLIGTFVAVANLVADVLFTLLNPRVRQAVFA